jgi:hypothetical protein
MVKYSRRKHFMSFYRNIQTFILGTYCLRDELVVKWSVYLNLPPFSLPPPLPLPEAYMKFRQSHSPDQREEKDKRDGPAFPLLQSGWKAFKVFLVAAKCVSYRLAC